MNPSSERRLTRLQPILVAAIRDIAKELESRGINVEVVQGYRTFAEQQLLYEKGRTKPGEIVTQAKAGESSHNYGLAADLCPFADGKPLWTAGIEVWVDIGHTAAKYGLEWGGAWKKFMDKPHVQLPNMTIAQCQKCFARGGLEDVWNEVRKRNA